MLKQVATRKWFWQFEHPAALIPLYQKHLIAGGAMTGDEIWFREMWLTYCRNLHVWDSEPVEWRGGCHRSMPEAFARAGQQLGTRIFHKLKSGDDTPIWCLVSAGERRTLRKMIPAI